MPIVKEEQFREPTPMEKGLIARLLTVDFPGKIEISEQLANCKVRTVDDDGSLELKPDSSTKLATVRKRIPVEAQSGDNGGIQVHLLLHVVDGFVNELEIYRDDGQAIKQLPRPEEFEVLVLPG